MAHTDKTYIEAMAVSHIAYNTEKRPLHFVKGQSDMSFSSILCSEMNERHKTIRISNISFFHKDYLKVNRVTIM